MTHIQLHDWKQVPGQSTVWHCPSCGAYTRGEFRTLTWLGCPGKQHATSKTEAANVQSGAEQKRFQKCVDRLGRIGVVYRLRQVHGGCWDWEATEKGLKLLDDAYQELLLLPWEDVLPLLEG